MGRVKLDIKKLENSSSRQATYSKRKHGILKKAHELSILCDIDLILVMFSPGGKPSLVRGKNTFEEVIAKYNQLPPQERTKKKLEGLEALKRTYKKKSEHDVNIQDFIVNSTPTVKDLTDQAARIQTRVTEIHERLRYWANPDKVSDLELVMQMEDSLQKSLEHIQRAKEDYQKRQRMSLESYTEFPYHVGGEQQLQRLLWTSSNDMQSVLTPETKLSTQRELESCTGSTSGSYFGCLSTGIKSEEDSPGQLSGIDNIGQDTFQGLQFGGQYPYMSLALNMQGDSSLQAMLGMDQRLGAPAYGAGGNYQPTLPWPDISNDQSLESPADSAFGYYLNYQKSTLPTTVVPLIYERMNRDSSHLLFDNMPNHQA